MSFQSLIQKLFSGGSASSKEDSSEMLGLDIGSYSVKMVKINLAKVSQGEPIPYAIVPLNRDKTPFENTVAAIKEAYDIIGTSCKKVNHSITHPNTIVRYLIFPWMNDSELASSLEFEIEKYVPYKKDEAIIDYRIIARLPDNKMLVLLIALEQSLMKERTALMDAVGLESNLITVDPSAYAEVFKLTMAKEKGVAAILDVGFKVSKLVVIENSIPYFSREIETGQQDIIQLVADEMRLSFEEAKILTYDPKDKLETIIERIRPSLSFNNLLDELYLSFEYCERNLGKKVEKVFLVGGGFKIKTLLDAFTNIKSDDESEQERVLSLKTEFWNPTAGLRLTTTQNDLATEESSYLLALALGLGLS